MVAAPTIEILPGAASDRAEGASSKPPRRAPGRLRAEAILSAADQLIAAQGAAGLSLPAVAAAAGASPSSLYHFFPTLDALLAVLLQRYNDLQDQQLRAATAAAAPFVDW